MVTSKSTYLNYIAINLPEYRLVGDSIPSPPNAVVLELHNASLARHKGGAMPFATVQPARLEFRAEKRFGQLKHFKEKREKIIDYLSRDCPQKGLVLKKYTSWNKFTVGNKVDLLDDLEYAHLALLKANTADLASGFMFYVRRFFHHTTPEMKEAYIRKYMKERCKLHVLVHFEHNNMFFVGKAATTSGIGSHAGDNEGIFNFYSARKGKWIDVQGTMLTSMSQLTAYCTDISGPISNLWNEHKIATEVARVTKIMEDAGFGGRDQFQQLVAEVEVSMQGGLMNTATKGIKEAIFGKHCRTHPVRATRVAFGKIFGIVKMAIPKILREAGFKVAKVVAETVIEHAGQGIQIAETAATGTQAIIATKPVPQWVQDLGLSKSEDDLNKDAWKAIQDHIDSLEKWETRFIELETKIKEARREKVVTCQQMNDLLRCYAKIQFHIEALLKCYGDEINDLQATAQVVREVKTRLDGFEDLFKTKAVQFLNKERNQSIIVKQGGATREWVQYRRGAIQGLQDRQPSSQ